MAAPAPDGLVHVRPCAGLNTVGAVSTAGMFGTKATRTNRGGEVACCCLTANAIANCFAFHFQAEQRH